VLGRLVYVNQRVLFVMINRLWDVPIFGAHRLRLMANAQCQKRAEIST
jgi:hypothetical protein